MGNTECGGNAQELIASLWQALAPRPFWRRDGGTTAQARSLMQRLAEVIQAGDVVYVIPIVMARDRTLARMAADAVQRVVSGLSPGELVELDHTVRSWLRHNRPGKGSFLGHWYDLDLRGVAYLAGCGDAAVSLLGLASYHRIGHVRQRAVELLARLRDGSELPFLLIRLNDWVPQVRRAAEKAVRERIVPEYASHFLRCMPLLLRLEGWRRRDRTPLLDWTALTADTAWRDALAAGMISDDRGTRRECLRQTILADPSTAQQLLQGALGDRDTGVRMWAVEQIASQADLDGLRAMLPLVLATGSVSSRGRAIMVYLDKLPDEAPAVLHEALLDSHSSIREMARFYMGKQGEGDFATLYRRALAEAEGPRLRAAIGGLGEVGKTDDVDRLSGFLAHAFPRVRVAAVRAIARLDAKANVGRLIDAVADASPRVSRQALKCVEGHVGARWADALRELLRRTPHSHVKRNCLTLIARCGKWAGLPLLLEACLDEDEAVRDHAVQRLEHWVTDFNRTFTRPSPDEHQAAREALARVGSVLDERLSRELAFLLELQ